MRKLIFLIAVFIYGFAFSQQTINASITHDGGQRDYILYVPASYNGSTAVPLLMCFHGYGSNNSTLMSYSNFNSVADTANFLVVYPQGTQFSGNAHWNVGGWTTGSTVDDVGFVDALLDSLVMDYNIDSDRVYSTGMSNGGYMSFLLACQLSDRIAAIASVTGSMTPQTFTACNPQHPIPVLQIHGDADATVPYGGDTWTESIPDVLNYWKNFNNGGSPDTTAIPNTITWDNSTVDNIQYEVGDNCTFVEHFKVYGGGHDWPGAWGNMDISATDEVWNFLRQFTINGIEGCFVDVIENESVVEVQVYPNPSQGIFNINSPKTIDQVDIISLDGRILESHQSSSFNISHLPTGTYILYIQIGDNVVKKRISKI